MCIGMDAYDILCNDPTDCIRVCVINKPNSDLNHIICKQATQFCRVFCFLYFFSSRIDERVRVRACVLGI